MSKSDLSWNTKSSKSFLSIFQFTNLSGQIFPLKWARRKAWPRAYDDNKKY